jgi:hypothetical protein
MSYGKQGSKSLAIGCLAALGLLVLGHAGAQAQEFKIEGKTFKELEIGKESITGELEGTLTLLILKLNVVIKCTGGEVTDATMLPLGIGHGLLASATCNVFDHKGNESLCEPHPFHGAGGTLLISHNGKTYGLLEPPAGQPFMIKKYLGELCTLPQEAVLKGSVVGEVTQLEAVEQLLSVSPGLLTLFINDKLFYGSHEVHVTGSVLTWLTGLNKGKKWGVL